MSLIWGTPQRSPEGDVGRRSKSRVPRRTLAPGFVTDQALTLGAAAALFAAVLGLRFTVHTTEDPITLLFCLPIALLAVAFGLRAGLLAGLSGVLLVAVWVSVEHLSLSFLGCAVTGRRL